MSKELLAIEELTDRVLCKIRERNEGKTVSEISIYEIEGDRSDRNWGVTVVGASNGDPVQQVAPQFPPCLNWDDDTTFGRKIAVDGGFTFLRLSRRFRWSAGHWRIHRLEYRCWHMANVGLAADVNVAPETGIGVRNSGCNRPAGQISRVSNFVSSPFFKNFPFCDFRKSLLCPPLSCPKRGALAIVTNVGTGCGGRGWRS